MPQTDRLRSADGGCITAPRSQPIDPIILPETGSNIAFVAVPRASPEVEWEVRLGGGGQSVVGGSGD